MIEKGWTPAALRKYILLEIPPLLLFAGFLQLLRVLAGLPLWAAGTLLAGWVIKDVVRVLDQEGLTLIVEPVSPGHTEK